MPASAKRSAFLFDTYVTVTIYGESEEKLSASLDKVMEQAEEWESVLSPTGSTLAQVNAAALQKPVMIPDELWEPLEISRRYGILSDGALDCTMGKLISLWGIGTDHPYIPDASEVQALLPVQDALAVDEGTHTVQFLNETVQLHFGAVAKGCMADWMAEILQENGITSGTIDLGGNILTIGTKPDGTPWRVGIANPQNPSEVLGLVEGSGFSVVTSGDYERYFEKDGIRYHHILNPGTGFPAESGLAGVSILGTASADCDALSTAVFVLGEEKGLALIESLPGFEAVLVTSEGEIRTSSGIADYGFEVAE